MLSAKTNIFLAACTTLAFASSAGAAQTQIEKTPEEKKWEQALRAGVDALDTNKYWIAEPTLKKAVVEAGSFGIKDLRLARSLGELGRLYTVRGRFEEAEPLLEEELYIKQQVLEEEGDQLVPAMASLIKFYLNYGSKSKGGALTDEMLSIVEGKLQESSHKPKSKISRIDGKITLEAWAGVASQAVRDPFIEWAIACDSVAAVYNAQGNFEAAERLYKAALEVKETVLGKNHLSLANSYDSLGGMALSRKDYMTAESHLKDAYQMSARILPKSSPQVYSRLDKLAKCLIQEGKRTEAEQLYLNAQHFWTKEEAEKTSDPIRACYSLGNMYCEDKNYEAAEPLLKKAMNEAQNYFGECSESLVPYIQRYAYVQYYLGHKAESDELKARAAAITGSVMIAENSRPAIETKPTAGTAALKTPPIRLQMLH